jgi:glycosyltransferase involved in cell wall biosynthesis
VDQSQNFCFFAERQVGIGAAAGALEQYMKQRGNVAWFDVTYQRPGGFIERLPLPPRVKGTLRGYAQTGEALRRGPYAGLLFLTHNPAILRQQTIGRIPTLLWTDVTPALLDRQAEQYAHPVSSSRVGAALKHWLVRRAFRRASVCVGWSSWARESFCADYGVPRERTAVIPPGVDLGAFSVGEPPPHEKPRLLFVGGHFRRKGGDLLLSVYRNELSRRCELDLVTRDAVADEEGVRVHRTLTAGSEELRELYRKATALVLPTRGDCFSIAALEAMASGLPVVITGVGGIPEIVENGRSGYVVAPDDARGLRDAIDRILSDRLHGRALGARGRALVEERYDARKTAAALIDALLEASGGRLR